MSKEFNDAFRRALRPEPESDPAPAPPPRPARPESIDGGAGTHGDLIRPQAPSMNDLIRHASRERE